MSGTDVIADWLIAAETALGRRDPTWPGGIEALLDPAFLEVGASGRTWTRATIGELLAQPTPETVRFVDFDVIHAGEDAALVTYRTVEPDRVARRRIGLDPDRRDVAPPLPPGHRRARRAGDDRLMADWLYFIHPPRDDFAATMTDEERAVWAVHFERFERALADGTLILAGPTLGSVNTGLAIFEAPDEATARRFMDDDPVIAGGFARGELRPFRVSLLRGRD